MIGTTRLSKCARLSLFLAAATFAWGQKSPERAVLDTPDLALINGKVLTVDAKDSVAQAIAIRNGKIIAVGSSRNIGRLVGGRTRVIDLSGRTVTPGLIDTHGHFADGGVNELYHVNLSDAVRAPPLPSMYSLAPPESSFPSPSD